MSNHVQWAEDNPEIAARVVVRAFEQGGNVPNARAVLVAALGPKAAEAEIRRTVAIINEKESKELDADTIITAR